MSALPDGYQPATREQNNAVIERVPFTIPNASILLLPTTPFVIVSATETLNYTGFPTSLFIPVKCCLLFDFSAGAYTNMNAANRLILCWGSDVSLDIGFAVGLSQIPDEEPYQYQLGVNPVLPSGKSFQTVPIIEGQLADDYLQDNAVAIKLDNRGDGPLEDGHANNTITGYIDGYRYFFPT